jgi:hypothetical protein
LLALCAEWHRAEDRYAEASEPRMGALDAATRAEARDLEHRAHDVEGELRERIFATKATAIPGLKAKAGIVHRVYRSDACLAEVAAELDRTTLGLLADLLALADGGAAA